MTCTVHQLSFISTGGNATLRIISPVLRPRKSETELLTDNWLSKVGFVLSCWTDLLLSVSNSLEMLEVTWVLGALKLGIVLSLDSDCAGSELLKTGDVVFLQ